MSLISTDCGGSGVAECTVVPLGAVVALTQWYMVPV